MLAGASVLCAVPYLVLHATPYPPPPSLRQLLACVIADVWAQSVRGQLTALDYAVASRASRNLEISRLLVEHAITRGELSNQLTRTVLRRLLERAATAGHIETVRYLLALGEQCASRGVAGGTVSVALYVNLAPLLQQIAQLGHHRVLSMLLAHVPAVPEPDITLDMVQLVKSALSLPDCSSRSAEVCWFYSGLFLALLSSTIVFVA